MPNYKYKCTRCKEEDVYTLPMSFDPSLVMICGKCGESSMTRRIGLPSFPTKVGKVWASDWFKKTYGHELGEKDKGFVTEQQKIKDAVGEIKRDYGINIKEAE